MPENGAPREHPSVTARRRKTSAQIIATAISPWVGGYLTKLDFDEGIRRASEAAVKALRKRGFDV